MLSCNQEKIDWVNGDLLNLDIPAHSQALLSAGADYLTKIFHQSGSLGKDNRITTINGYSEIYGGSTGRKLSLTVSYEIDSPHLHNNLFVKFSRDFESPVRDAGRMQMELEVKFALLSMNPGFPINVPTCYFSDFHRESGTGILITQCIPYGRDSVEIQYPKALDYKMPEQLEHYRALIKSLARLAGNHKAGQLSDVVKDYFSFDPDKLDVSTTTPYTPQQISEKVADFVNFTRSCPQFFPANIRTETFLKRLADEAPRFQALHDNFNYILRSKQEMVALCHWNAHVDNAWFWKDEDNQLQCGLMDWGNVSQMNVAMAIWGCLSAAELTIWDDHLDELLELFIREFKRSGGEELPIQDLKLHLIIYVVKMGLAWLLDRPLITLVKIPYIAEVGGRFDSCIESNEAARAQLTIMNVFLNLWERTNMNGVIHYMEDIAKQKSA